MSVALPALTNDFGFAAGASKYLTIPKRKPQIIFGDKKKVLTGVTARQRAICWFYS